MKLRIVMHDEFITVKSKRHTRKRWKNTRLPSPGRDREPVNNYKINSKLSEISKRLERGQFARDLLENIRLVLNRLEKTENVIDNILCYGLGKFSENSCSLHQLAILIFLHKTFESVVEIYDPIFSESEIRYLKEIGFTVIESNEEGKHIVDDKKLTLVFLPHCPKQLVNNFLWANWNINLKNCIVISNSFSKIIEDNTKKTIAHSANYILESLKFFKEIQIRDTYEYSNVLNDTSIHYFHYTESGIPSFQCPAQEPIYLEDTEFITKGIETLTVKNE